MNRKLRLKFLSALDSPGVYLIKDASGRVLYIGKAKSLKKRLASYLKNDLSAKTQAFMLKACDIETRLCSNESMALLLEAALIRKYKPKYNISLRDDKSFPMVKITKGEFPAIYITRKRDDDGARYFGPYTNAGLLKQAMKVIRRHFPYLIYKQMPQEARIDRAIGLSPKENISRFEYAKKVGGISLILKGKTESLIEGLSKEMREKSKAMDFEGAGKIRDQINALGAISGNPSDPTGGGGLKELKKFLKGGKDFSIIEAFDISNLSGRQACGSMVRFLNGVADKKNYRRFCIKTVEGIDDYGMLREVVRRRYSRALDENIILPGLIIIDGGKGHLLAAQDELRGLGLEIPLLSIAKKEENIYIKGSKMPVKLNQFPSGLNLIRRIRDEAHRFALSYHHILRKKKTICS